MPANSSGTGERFSPEQRMMYYLFLIGFFAIFSTTISKNPVLPLFTQALGADGGVCDYRPNLVVNVAFPRICPPIAQSMLSLPAVGIETS
jgi:hypothetical protein